MGNVENEAPGPYPDTVRQTESMTPEESAPELSGPTVEQTIEEHIRAIMDALIQSISYVQESPNLSSEDKARFQRLNNDLINANEKCWRNWQRR